VRVTIPREELQRLAGGKRGIRVGDLIRRVTAAIGMKSCGGCKERQKSLNRFEVRW
jgi:hypothetical protein